MSLRIRFLSGLLAVLLVATPAAAVLCNLVCADPGMNQDAGRASQPACHAASGSDPTLEGGSLSAVHECRHAFDTVKARVVSDGRDVQTVAALRHTMPEPSPARSSGVLGSASRHSPASSPPRVVQRI
jgi:hypothetical protein